MKFKSLGRKVGKRMVGGVKKMGKDFKGSKIAKASRTPAHLTPPKGRRLF